MKIEWPERMYAEDFQARPRRSTVKNGFVGPMNKYSGFMARDTRPNKTIDLDPSQWSSRVINTKEGSGQ